MARHADRVRVRAIATRTRPGVDAALAGLFACMISMLGAGRPSLWVDEAATVSASTRSPSRLWTLVGDVDLVHAVYYLMMQGWLTVFPVTEFWIRVPSAVFVGVAATGVVVLGAQLSTRRVAVAAGIVFAVLPRTTLAGVEARPYALTMVCAVWLTVWFVTAVRRPRWWRWAAYGVLLALTAVINILAPLTITAHAAMLFALSASRRVVTAWVVATAGAVVAVLPFAVAVMAQQGQISWIWPISPVTLGQIFGEQYFPSVYTDGLHALGPEQREFSSENLDAALPAWGRVAPLIVVLVGLAVAAVRRRRALEGSPRVLLWGCGTWVLAPTALLVLYSLIGAPLYQPQYLSFTTPALALLVGLCVATAAPSARRIALVLLVIGLAALPNYVAQRSAYAKFGSDASEVARLLATRGGPGECLVLATDLSAANAMVGARIIHGDALRDITLESAALEADSLFGLRQEVSAADLRDCSAVWSVVDITAESPAAPGFRPVERWRFNQGQAVKSVPQ